jgi:hypothetical protein
MPSAQWAHKVSVSQTPIDITHAANFARSAIVPDKSATVIMMDATVIMAKVI